MKQFGRYEVLEEIGSGAMGAVFKARDPVMDRVVAVKTVHASALVGPLAEQYRERFTREARAAGKLAHAGIVTVFDAGVEGETPYLVMEFVPGRTLESVLNSGEHYTVERIYEIGQQIADALGFAHSNGVIHRDIKPANIQLTGAPERAKIMDFGVAKLTQAQVTSTGTLLGTPAFMAPEQFTGMAIDGRADIFSLGIILYWMATGDKPFSGDTITAVSYKIVHTEPIPPRQLNPGVPAPLEAVILRCLAKDPAARYQTGEELAAELAALRGLMATGSALRMAPAAPAGSGTISTVATIPLKSGGEVRRSAFGAQAAPAAAGTPATQSGQRAGTTGGVGRSAASVAPAAPARAPAPEIPRHVTPAPAPSGGSKAWIYLLVVVLVAGLAWAGLTTKKKKDQAAAQVAASQQVAPPSVPLTMTPPPLTAQQQAQPSAAPVNTPAAQPATPSAQLATPPETSPPVPSSKPRAESAPKRSPMKPEIPEPQPDLSIYALRLQVSATAPANVEITADDNAPQTRSLRAGDSFRVGADKIFQVRTDNAGGIHLKLNDKDLPELGPLGSPRTARLTARNLAASGGQAAGGPPTSSESPRPAASAGGKGAALQAQLDVEVTRLANFADLSVWVDGNLLVERPGEMKGGGDVFSKLASIPPGRHTIAVFIGKNGKGKRDEVSGDFSAGQTRTLRVNGHFQGRREAGMFLFDLALE